MEMFEDTPVLVYCQIVLRIHLCCNSPSSVSATYFQEINRVDLIAAQG